MQFVSELENGVAALAQGLAQLQRGLSLVDAEAGSGKGRLGTLVARMAAIKQ